MLVFKYLPPSGAKGTLGQQDRLSIRFSLPSTYNDPFELFLLPDDSLDRDEQACYKWFLGEIKEFPVSCLSRRPDSPAMWAHYTTEQQGLCVGLDEDAFCSGFSSIAVGNVRYTDDRTTAHASAVRYAYNTGKARHMRSAIDWGYDQAYFTKRTEWQYEQERRYICNLHDLTQSGTLLLANVPSKDSCKCIILGKNVDKDLRGLATTRARELDIPLYDVRFGRRTPDPYFVDVQRDNTSRWNGDTFAECKRTCPDCLAPVSEEEMPDDPPCAWCRISERDAGEAAASNLLPAFWHLGLEVPSITFPSAVIKGKQSVKALVQQVHPQLSPPRPPDTE